MNIALLKKLTFIISAVIFLALVVIIKSNPGILTRKTKGSFEYVRMGEDYLNKGKYKDAIAYFEKAYSESPGNKIIQSNLAYSYIRYSAAMADAGNYDEAIRYSKSALAAAPGASTRQNLAIVHAKKGLTEARKSNWAEAIGQFSDARSAAADSNIASKNLGMYLFNDAVGEFKAGNEKLAILCLKESSLVYDEPRVFEFLGDVYYRRSELGRALFFFDKATEINPDDKTLSEKLAKVSKEIELAKTNQSKESAHFEIRYGKGSGLDARFVEEAVEKAYADIGNDLGYFPPSRTVIFFYSKEDFATIFKMPRLVGAFYDGNIRMPLPEGGMTGEDISHYIRHEYTHAVISALTNNNCPIWLQEGIAMWEEYKGRDSLIKQIFSKAAGDESFSIESLDGAFKGGKNPEEISSYYILAYTAVRYIVDRWGLDGLRDLLRRLSDGRHIVNAIDDEFLLSEKEFNERWADYAHKAYL